MKTALINVYRPHGQHNKVASVYYRGKLLHTACFANTTLHGSTQGLIDALSGFAPV